MTFFYCECGHKMTRGLEPLNFCSGCGKNLKQEVNITSSTHITSINSLPKSPSIPLSPPITKKIHPKRQRVTEAQTNDVEDDTEDDDNNDDININVPNISPEDVEDLIDFDIPKGGIKLNLSSNKNIQLAKLSKGKKIKQVSQKQFLAELKRDGGNSNRNQ